MKKDNPYWSIYKNLEREILILSNQIHFDDNQLNVYSIKIVELLIRCSVEIESIAKELYEQEGGNMNPVNADGRNRDLYFDTDCMDFLENKWSLSKKKVLISAPTFYFTEEKYNTLKPLNKAHKRGTSGAKWKQAYQAIKHNRAKNLSKGNIANLIEAMAALYLLNIYLKNEKVILNKGEFGSSTSKNFDESQGSDIFSILMSFVSFPSIKPKSETEYHFNPLDYASSVYLQIADDATCDREWNRVAENTQKIATEIINIILEKGISPDFSKKRLLFQLAGEVGGEQFGRRAAIETRPRIQDIVPIAVVNKNQMIYTQVKL
jgi:hypothetical protein